MKSLDSSNIVITKSINDVSSKFLILEKYCNSIYYLPTIKIESLINNEFQSKLNNDLDKYHYIVFTSKNAVEVFVKSFSEKLELINKKIIVAIGEATASKLNELNLRVDIIPESFSSQGLINLFSKLDINSKHILIPTSKLSANDFKINLENQGAIVDLIHIYNVLPNFEIRNNFEFENLENIDIYIFTSPSSFNNFLKIFEINNIDIFFNKKIICAIGRTTEKAINNYGLNVNIVPQNYSLDYLTDALIKFYNLQNNIA